MCLTSCFQIPPIPTAETNMTINRFLDPKSKRDSRKRLYRETCVHSLLVLHLSASHDGASLTMNPGFRSCPFVCFLCLWMPIFVVWDRSATLWLQFLNGMSFCFCATLPATCLQNPWCQPPACLVVHLFPPAKSIDTDLPGFQDICPWPTVEALGCWQLAILAWTFAHYLLTPSSKALCLSPCVQFLPVLKIIHSFKDSFIHISINAFEFTFSKC